MDITYFFLNKIYGYFVYKNIHMVPFQHHMHKACWKVLLTENLEADPYIKSATYNIVAPTAKEASIYCYEIWVRNKKQKQEEELNVRREERIQNTGTKG
jgi:hypothetical protein